MGRASIGRPSGIPEAGLEVVESRYVVDDLVKLITARA